MKGKVLIKVLALTLICPFVLSSCCSIPNAVNTGGVPKSERVEIHTAKAELVYIDGKMVSMNKVLWLVSTHLVTTKGDHDLKVNYWERSVFSRSPKKLHFTAEPGKKYYVDCEQVRAGKSLKKKSKKGKYLFQRKGGEYLKDADGYLYTYKCCIKDKATDETLSCK